MAGGPAWTDYRRMDTWMTQILQGHARRLTELDPCEPALAGTAPAGKLDSEAEAEVSYGCVDWYVYRAECAGPEVTPPKRPQ